ncbi:hypothetical protein DERP_007908 [Dermatophagoides pteronyssinus]|uniref:Uncharacterized protein n=1 Tax=Dermatophagoides pteronyssinus TaxID=6956 RepID=A0ABQ8IT73_DERPT|nr:hypothetical protein DERP_007908 [Dermatophagoides pteronyssinus]
MSIIAYCFLNVNDIGNDNVFIRSIFVFIACNSVSLLFNVVNSSSKNDAEQRRGFPINLRICDHSIRVKYLVFNCGNESFKHKLNSFSSKNNT